MATMGFPLTLTIPLRTRNTCIDASGMIMGGMDIDVDEGHRGHYQNNQLNEMFDPARVGLRHGPVGTR